MGRDGENRLNSSGQHGSWIKDILIILAGAVPYGMSIVAIDGIETMPAGGVGIATILHFITGQPIGKLNLIVNIPLMLIGTKVLGKRMLIYTAVTIVSTSFLMDYMLAVCPVRMADMPLAATVIGALLMGVSSGIVMSTGATFAGTTVIVRLIQTKKPNLKAGSLLVMLDGIIISIGALIQQNIRAFLLSAVYTIIVSYTINVILYTLPKVFHNYRTNN